MIGTQENGLGTANIKSETAMAGRKTRWAESSRRYRKSLRKKMLDHYGHRCNWCWEDDEMALVIDHVNNDGHLDKKKLKCHGGSPVWVQVVKEGFPDRFQVLCASCNTAKLVNKGVLPQSRRLKYAPSG